MDNAAIVALASLVIFVVIGFVGLFTVARLLMRDRKVRQVRIGFYMERDRDRYGDDDLLPVTYSSDSPTMVIPPKES